eukprot:CAMPEP_0183290912 /NCGR_PEP_ID=MMETSP0160_2-20130417/493_1 /TAXON_ID=2839 ORGANISM="Odontella Sinensis, Strain Grunow 1884" /NCGR_SAMPLE_ID=MMETSP0160_2 /ASSEMBLY_ACC=CAM_ASM_000250 /LENGTH=213 /DNA_ID=CAMNT_0025451625 /DNA_START=210 /DNA_END=848 /DNA_ORIENTATION=-
MKVTSTFMLVLITLSAARGSNVRTDPDPNHLRRRRLGNTAYITYHMYDPSTSTNVVSCSDGTHGLRTRWGYDTLSPMYPYVSAVSNLHWNSPNCGICYRVTASNGNAVHVTAIDQCGATSDADVHFDMAPEAFDELLGLDGYLRGHGYATFEEVDPSNCKGNLGTSSGSSGGGGSNGGDSGGGSTSTTNPPQEDATGTGTGTGTCGGGNVGDG